GMSGEILREAADPGTAPARLRALAGLGWGVARVVAQNPQAPPDLLAGLAEAGDEETREGVAGNPNAPIEVLFRLGARYPGRLLGNPLFPLLFLESPDS